MLTRETLQALKHRTNLANVLSLFLALEPSGRGFRARCPFHDDTDPSLRVDPERGRWRCFGCHAGGDVFDFVQRFEALDFFESVHRVADLTGVSLSELSESTPPVRTRPPLQRPLQRQVRPEPREQPRPS